MHGRKAMPDKDHWDGVYRDRAGDDLSWYQAHAEQSLELINRCGLDREAPLIDIGGGTSYLAAALLQLGYRDVSVLDISPVALVNARAGLGSDAARVHWMEADVTKAHLPAARFALWHDRAVFHFLTARSDRSAYVDTLRAALRPGGDVIIATFAEDGPDPEAVYPLSVMTPQSFRRRSQVSVNWCIPKRYCTARRPVHCRRFATAGCGVARLDRRWLLFECRLPEQRIHYWAGGAPDWPDPLVGHCSPKRRCNEFCRSERPIWAPLDWASQVMSAIRGASILAREVSGKKKRSWST